MFFKSRCDYLWNLGIASNKFSLFSTFHLLVGDGVLLWCPDSRAQVSLLLLPPWDLGLELWPTVLGVFIFHSYKIYVLKKNEKIDRYLSLN